MYQESITPEQALKLIEPLKEHEFIVMTYTDGISRCCVMGHLTRLTSDNPNDYSMDNCNALYVNRLDRLREKAEEVLSRRKGLPVINNGYNENYPQKTIKARVTAALKDIIKLEKS